MFDYEKWLDRILPTMKRDDPLRPKFGVSEEEKADEAEELRTRLLQLIFHITSGDADIYFVNSPNGNYGPYSSYELAMGKFIDINVSGHTSIMLATRIGTAVEVYSKDI